MADLYLQRKDVDLVINFPLSRPLEDFEYIMDGMLWQYAYIIHDKDIKDSGELKTKHIHLVICSPKRHQLKYFIRIVADALGVNDNQVSILPCDNVGGRIQYLIHKNNKEKYQYPSSDIRTNFNEGVLNDYLEEDTTQTFTTADIINICRESNGNRLFIIQKIGISRYTMYRNTINDIYKAMLYVEDKYI